jgi:large repetitive protein
VLTSDANVYKPSTTIHYQITVTNFGPSDAQNVVITQALPPVKQGKYISNNIGCAPPVGTTLTCQAPAVPGLTTIPAGGSITFQVNFFITGNKGTITSTATVTSATTDPVTSNNSSTRVVTVK